MRQARRRGSAKSAFVIDIREREFFEEGKGVLKKIKEKYGAELIFLESSDEMLFRRFKETRRAHPFYDASNIREALGREREQMGWIKEIADKVIDTSLFTTNGLRNFVISTYGERREEDEDHTSSPSAMATAYPWRPTSCRTSASCRTPFSSKG